MARANNKTTVTGADPRTFLEQVEPRRRRDDGLALLELFNRVTGLKPQMWGPSIVGYGRYLYRYDSGREGEHFLTGFSPRKTALTVYIMPGYSDLAEPLSRLGKHRLGKSCLYLNKLAEIDTDVLAEIIELGLKDMRARYETWDA